ncbi:MAG: GIY-YIG nuclease family protein [Armatimonadetes bacterium]|nr:GIY-YIG nuclease family protein [Armatimonadota bacterium]CUU34820.1 protein of unknown function (DUF4357) [Armatimonadetes bacterium DC]
MTEKGFCVKIFIPSGDPAGLRIIEKSNWIGLGMVFPRVLFNEVSKREELKQAGVYILWGPSESEILPRVYIGESDCVVERLRLHVKEKEFWTHAIVFTTNCSPKLTKAHFKYIEYRLHSLASQAKLAEIENSNAPTPYQLSESDRAEAELFLQDILLCLPLAGVNFFEVSQAPQTASPSGNLCLRRDNDIIAWGTETSKGFVVLKGARALKETQKSIHPYLYQLRNELISQGVLLDKGTHFELTQDYLFNSPSMAAGVLLGRSANGLREWRECDGERTLKELRKGMVSAP